MMRRCSVIPSGVRNISTQQREHGEVQGRVGWGGLGETLGRWLQEFLVVINDSHWLKIHQVETRLQHIELFRVSTYCDLNS